jgi:hypothetical protein
MFVLLHRGDFFWFIVLNAILSNVSAIYIYHGDQFKVPVDYIGKS